MKWLPVRAWIHHHPEAGSRTFVYEAIARGELPSIRVGRKILIPDDALDRLYEAKDNHA